jgi:drug/metabolite transporter (DMT)-like permease
MKSEYWFVILAALLSGTLIFGARVLANLGLSLYQIATIPSLLSLLLLPCIFLIKNCKIEKGMLKFLAAYGFIGAVLALLEFGAVILGVPVAIVVLLVYTQPVWTLIFSRIFLKEQINRTKIIATILVLAGIVALVNPFTLKSLGSHIGIILALAGGVMLSMWVIFGRVCGTEKYHPVATQFGYSAFMILFLALFYPIVSRITQLPEIIHFSLNLPLNTWIYLIIFSLFAVILTHIFYFYGTLKTPASTAGIILLLEPVCAAVLALIFLSQPITWNILAGGALILASNWIVVRE